MVTEKLSKPIWRTVMSLEDWQLEYEQMTNKEAVEILTQDTAKTSPLKVNPDFVPHSAFGATVWEKSGKKCIDFSAGISSLNWGHHHPKIDAAIRWYLKHRVANIPPNTWPNKLAAILTKRLKAMTPGDFPKQAFYTVGGSNAVEDAMKHVLRYFQTTRRHVPFFSFYYGFHGRGGLALMIHKSSPIHRKYFVGFEDEATPLLFPEQGHNCAKYQGCNLPHIERLIDEHTHGGTRRAALFMECIQGEGGMNVGCFECLPRVVALFQSKNCLVIDDEVQMAWGRTGKMFAWEHYDFKKPADIYVFAKSFSPETSLSATVSRADIGYDDYGVNSATGPPVMGFATALAGLAIAKEIVGSEILRKGEEILKLLAPLGLGYMRAIECGTEERASEFVTKALAHNPGLILLRARTRVRISPPLTATEDELLEGIGVAKQVSAELGLIEA